MAEKDRIDELDQALEGGEPSSTEVASLVALVRMLEGLPEPEIDPAFAASLESTLVGSKAAAPVPSSLATINRIEERRARRIRRGLVAAIAAAMMLALPVTASAASVPGSAGYGIRLAREEARLWAICRTGAVKCGFAHLDRANARLHDLRGVLGRGDVAEVPGTSARLRASLTTGAQTVLAARPPVTTLRRLAKRLDETAIQLDRLAAAAPPALRNPIREAIGEGASLTHDVRLALGDVPVFVPPNIDPPPVVRLEPESRPQPQARPASPPSRANREPSKKPGGKNNFGPGGTPKVDRPVPGEDWHGDGPVREACPIGMVAAPGVDALCTAAGGDRP